MAKRLFRRTRTARADTGRRAEALAVRYLRRRFYRIVARNFSCPLGEVDIVASRGELLIFVEVRSRTGVSLVDPLETVDRGKRRRIVRAASFWLLRHDGWRRPVRLDVIAVRFTPDRRPRIRHVRDAFTGDDCGWEQPR